MPRQNRTPGYASCALYNSVVAQHKDPRPPTSPKKTILRLSYFQLACATRGQASGLPHRAAMFLHRRGSSTSRPLRPKPKKSRHNLYTPPVRGGWPAHTAGPRPPALSAAPHLSAPRAPPAAATRGSASSSVGGCLAARVRWPPPRPLPSLSLSPFPRPASTPFG